MAKQEIGLDPPARNPVLDQLPHSSFQAVKGAQPAAPHVGPPLPLGKPVTLNNLTPTEQQHLESLGWKAGDPIPGNLPDAIAHEQEQAKRAATDTSTMPPPARPDIPPLEMPDEVSIDQLPEHQKQNLKDVLATAGEQYEALKAGAPSSILPGAEQGVQAAAAGRTDREILVEDDREEKAAEAATAGDLPQTCPHCSWNLKIEDSVAVTDEDKNTFLIATLGGQPWQKSYDLFGGAMQVTVRMLRPYEVDECYKQARADQNKNLEDSYDEFLEMLMRYRLCLQLVDVRTGNDVKSFKSDLNEWGALAESEVTLLPRITQSVYRQVIQTESVNRILSNVMGDFGRLVAKLEVQVENSDFWSGTSSPA